jgi:hypothetical protein
VKLGEKAADIAQHLYGVAGLPGASRGYATEAIRGALMDALEAAAKIADTGMLVPPDGGSPTADEVRVAKNIAAGIRNLKMQSQ